MQQLIAEAKNGLAAPATPDNTPFPGLPISLGGLAFAGLLRSSRYGSSSIDVLTTPKYDVAANAAFTSLDTASGWNTQGSVDIAPASTSSGPSTGSGQSGMASATLNEVSTSQTRLSQVFMVGAQDRYLSFTLAGSALDNPSGAPQDAFEVALLDANTGASVLGTDGMTRSDAFLNLQADGGQHTASCVTCIHNSDGSRTYRVDLTNVAKNTAVNLSFDLLGFGASGSHVTLRDVRVSGLPQLHDDVATLLEDGTLAFNPFAQADAALRPMLASSVVNAPTHGAITVNADGTFSYKPDANYNGTDSFSYRLSDGPLDSNLATVSLTVTSVNDAPTGTNATVTTLENAPYVFQTSDFGFSDAADAGSIAGANNFAAVIIGSLPAAGTLTNNGVAVAAGQSITVADIAAGLLVFAPVAHANVTNDLAVVVGQPSQMASSSISAGYANFTFQVQDDGGTGGTTGKTTDKATSHSAKPQSAGQAAGYIHLTDETTGETTSHLTKAASCQVIGYSHSTRLSNSVA